MLRTAPRKGYMLVPAQRCTHLAGRVPALPSLAVLPFMSISAADSGQYWLTLGCGVASKSSTSWHATTTYV